MKKLVVIDGHAILHRAYHALPPLTTSKGEMVNAVYGFTSMLLRVIGELKPTHLVVAFDRPEPTFRNKLYKDYQIQRPKADEEFIPQIDLVKKLVTEIGIPIFEKEGFEADDVIGTIARKAIKETVSPIVSSTPGVRRRRNTTPGVSLGKSEIIIVTGDRDILQLVNDQIRVYMPVKGLSASKMYGEKEVEEKYGIKPSQIVDYKALVGDASDNYPGVAGIGPKTAATLLQRFQTLEQIFKQAHRVESDKVRKVLEENKKSAEMAKKLATIVTDVPIKLDIEKCKLPNLDKPNVHRLFEELEFRSLIPRLSGGIRKQEISVKQEEKKEAQQIQLFD